MLHCLPRSLPAALALAAGLSFQAAATDTSATDRTARIALPDMLEQADQSLIAFEAVTPQRTPNYLLMMAQFPRGPERMADMARSVLYGGALEPSLKMGMGRVIADAVGSPYLRAHMDRLLAATPEGRELLDSLSSGGRSALSASNAAALHMAEIMVADVNGLDDDGFARLRSMYREPEIVELTLTVCYFDYLARIVEALNLPVERWALSPARELPAVAAERTRVAEARIGLLSNEEVGIISDRLAQGAGTSSLGLSIANSVRAMARVPHVRQAWGNLSFGSDYEKAIQPVVEHHVSNTVSYQNGCLYCKTHQVQKLRRSGLSIDRIAAIIDNERLLGEPEQKAVRFARALSIDPASITDEDYRQLQAAFTERGAMEVLIVAARFNFMNRFTGSLRLPPEDAPRSTYEQIEQARLN